MGPCSETRYMFECIRRLTEDSQTRDVDPRIMIRNIGKHLVKFLCKRKSPRPRGEMSSVEALKASGGHDLLSMLLSISSSSARLCGDVSHRLWLTFSTKIYRPLWA